MQPLSSSPQTIALFASFLIISVLALSIWMMEILRKALSDRLIEIEKLKYLFTEINPTPIIRTDNTGIIIYCNKAAKKIFTKHTLAGLKIKDIFLEIRETKIFPNSNFIVSYEQKFYYLEARLITSLKNWQFYLKDITMQLILGKNTLKNTSNKNYFKTNFAKLTKREKQVFSLSNKGLTSKEIAKQLNCSTRTVTTHRYNLTKKMDLHSNI